MNKADIFKWKKWILAFSNVHIFITNSNLYIILKYNLYNIIPSFMRKRDKGTEE